MKLPYLERIYVSIEKLNDYLLSDTHPIGKWKARFFKSLGFDKSNIEMLEKTLISIAQSNEISESIKTTYGVKYIIDGTVHTPKKVIKLRTVWVIEKEEKIPKFVTAYPI